MIDVLGWIGSGLVVVSMAQRDDRRLRQLNLAAAAVLGSFNVLVELPSMIVLNVILGAVNGHRLFVGRRRAPTNEHDLSPSGSPRSEQGTPATRVLTR